MDATIWSKLTSIDNNNTTIKSAYKSFLALTKYASNITYNPGSATTYTLTNDIIIAKTLTIGTYATLQKPDTVYPAFIICDKLILNGVLSGGYISGGTGYSTAGSGGSGRSGFIIITRLVEGSGTINLSGTNGSNATYSSGSYIGSNGSTGGYFSLLTACGGYANRTGGRQVSSSSILRISSYSLLSLLNLITYNSTYFGFAGGGGGGGAHNDDTYNPTYTGFAGGGGGGPAASGGTGGNGSTDSGVNGAGGGGGGAGGVLFLITENNIPSIIVNANGGNGGNGAGTNGGGGGGGAGGFVVFIAPSYSATVNVSGGTGGTKSGTVATNGSNGGTGLLYHLNVSLAS